MDAERNRHAELRSRRRHGWILAPLGAVLAVAAGVLLLPGERLLPALHLQRGASPPAATQAAGPPSTAPASTSPPSASIGTAPTTAGRPPAPRARSRSARFGWAPVPGADYYLVRFFRGGRLVFETRAAQTTLVVPSRWTFGGRSHRLLAGRYRWSVVPGLGRPGARRYGRPVVNAVWVARAGRDGP